MKLIDLNFLDKTILAVVPPASPPPASPLVAALDEVLKATFTLPKGAEATSAKEKSLQDELMEIGDLEALKKDVDAIPDDLLALLDQPTSEVKKHLWGYQIEDMEKSLKPFSGSSLYADAAALIADIFRINAQVERLAQGEWDDLTSTYVDPDKERRKELQRKRYNLFADLQDLTARLFAERAERAAKKNDAMKGFGDASAEPKTQEEREDAAPPAAPSLEGELSPAEAKEKEDAERTAKAEERGEDQDEKGGDG